MGSFVPLNTLALSPLGNVVYFILYRLIARFVMAAMLVVRNNKIFLLWGLTSIFMRAM